MLPGCLRVLCCAVLYLSVLMASASPADAPAGAPCRHSYAELAVSFPVALLLLHAALCVHRWWWQRTFLPCATQRSALVRCQVSSCTVTHTSFLLPPPATRMCMFTFSQSHTLSLLLTHSHSHTHCVCSSCQLCPTAVLCIKRAVLAWAGNEQAGSVQLLPFLEEHTHAWRQLSAATGIVGTGV